MNKKSLIHSIIRIGYIQFRAGGDGIDNNRKLYFEKGFGKLAESFFDSNK